MEVKVERTEANTEIPTYGNPLDAPVVFAEGVSGLTVDSFTAKLFLFHRANGPDGKLAGKISTTLVLSRDGLRQLHEALTTVLSTITRDEAAAAEAAAARTTKS